MLIPSFALALVLAAGPTPRPLLHFTPEKNWTNDPNGLIRVGDEYHIFYQANPFGDQWGHMSWGHAVSKDLFTWQHLPVAIPEENGVMIFSGSAVLDEKNTSGFGTAANPPMIAIYTGHNEQAHRQHQNIAYSIDHGRTWTKFAGNPVIDLGLSDFRDPKVFWHEPTHKWVMIVSESNEHRALLFGSPDLKKWTKLSTFGPAGRKDVPNWECPDLFEMPITGEPGQTRWVAVANIGGHGPTDGGGVQYFVGKFDGTTFTNENPNDTVLWVDWGKDFYAFQTYANIPDKRIGLAWMSSPWYAGAQPTSPWRGSMSVPREFTLVRTPEGLRLAQQPCEDGIEKTIAAHGGKKVELHDVALAGIKPTGAIGQVATILAEFDVGQAKRVGLRVREKGEQYTLVGFDATKSELFIDRSHSGKTDLHGSFPQVQTAPVHVKSGHVAMRIVVDENSVEAFSGDGLAAITCLVFPDPASEGISAFSEGGEAKLTQFRAQGCTTSH